MATEADRRYEQAEATIGQAARVGARAVVEAMAAAPADGDVQLHGLRALNQMMIPNGSEVEVARSGAVRACLSAMQTHPDDDAVNADGCGVLAQLTKAGGAAAAAVVAAGGIRAIVGAMTRFREPDDEGECEPQRTGAHALANLCTYKREHAAQVAADGGLDAVTWAMRTYKGVAAAQAETCRCLARLSRHLPAECVGVGLKPLCDVMAALPHAVPVQVHGCEALLAMSAHPQAAPALRARGVAAACGAVRAQPLSEHILEASLVFVYTLETRELQKGPAMDEPPGGGGADGAALGAFVKAVCSALDEASHSEQLEIKALQAFIFVAARGHLHARLVVEGGGVPLAVRATRYSKDVARAGVMGLSNWATFSAALAAAVLDGGGLTATVACMEKYRGDLGILDNGCRLISNLLFRLLGMRPGLVRAMIDQGGAEALVDAISRCQGSKARQKRASDQEFFGSEYELQVQAMRGLHILLDPANQGRQVPAGEIEEAAKCIAEAKGVKRILRAYRKSGLLEEAAQRDPEISRMPDLHLEERLKQILERLGVLCGGGVAEEVREGLQRAVENAQEGCVSCGQTAKGVGINVLLRCSACTLNTPYCSKECQQADWNFHKTDCKANRAGGGGGEAAQSPVD